MPNTNSNHSEDSFFYKFVATCIFIVFVGGCYVSYKSHCRTSAMETFCKSRYGNEYTMVDWREHNRNVFTISCAATSSMVRIDY